MIYHITTAYEIYNGDEIKCNECDHVSHARMTCDNCDGYIDHGDELLHMYVIDGGRDSERFFCERECHDEYVQLNGVEPMPQWHEIDMRKARA